jgi:hypothetical protein
MNVCKIISPYGNNKTARFIYRLEGFSVLFPLKLHVGIRFLSSSINAMCTCMHKTYYYSSRQSDADKFVALY